LADYRALRADADRGARFVVIGGGFIGSEVAASLRKRGNDVTLVFPEAGISDRLFPAEMAAFLNDTYRQQGVEVLPGESVIDIAADADGATVTLGSGRTLAADRVVAGIGIVPDVALARAAGLASDNGILVDENLQTTRPGIYAAGDVANYPDLILGGRRRRPDTERHSGSRYADEKRKLRRIRAPFVLRHALPAFRNTGRLTPGLSDVTTQHQRQVLEPCRAACQMNACLHHIAPS